MCCTGWVTPMGAMSHLVGEATEGKWRDSLQLPGGIQSASVATTGLALVQVCRMKKKGRMLASDPYCSRAAGRGLGGDTMGGGVAHLCAQRLHISDQCQREGQPGKNSQHIVQGSCKPPGACCPQGTTCAVTPAVHSMIEILVLKLVFQVQVVLAAHTTCFLFQSTSPDSRN